MDNELLAFVQSTFRSVWTLELLLFLRRHPSRTWIADELVVMLRSSENVVQQGIASLLAAGLIVMNDSQAVRYAPASRALERLIEETETAYQSRPDAVRRAILAPGDKLQAFANAFRLRKD